MNTLIALTLLVTVISLMVWILLRKGGQIQKGKQAQRNLEGVSDAKKIRDKLISDPSFRERIRERFTRE